MKIDQLKAELKEKIHLLDKEASHLKERLEAGEFKSEKRKRQKRCIYCLYMTKLHAYLYVLNKIGGEEEFVNKIWGKRKSLFGSSYEKVFKKLKTEDYPEEPFIKI